MQWTIALLDTKTGWAFRLNNDNRRVWLDAYPSAAPVPVAFVAGERAAEFETIIGACAAANDMVIAARRVLPESIKVSALEELPAAA